MGSPNNNPFSNFGSGAIPGGPMSVRSSESTSSLGIGDLTSSPKMVPLREGGGSRLSPVLHQVWMLLALLLLLPREFKAGVWGVAGQEITVDQWISKYGTDMDELTSRTSDHLDPALLVSCLQWPHFGALY
jgi:hypothetical protein